MGLKISSYDRAYEPDAVRKVEGGTIPWGVEEAIEKIDDIPDVIYHEGAWGKEPMICVVGSDAVELAEMAVCIARLYKVEQKSQVKVKESIPSESNTVLFASSRKKWKDSKPLEECIFCSIVDGNPNVKEKALYNDGKNMVVIKMPCMINS